MLEQQQLQYMIYNIIIVSITLCLTVITLSRFIYIDDPYSKLWLLIPIFWIPPFTMIPSYFIYNMGYS